MNDQSRRIIEQCAHDTHAGKIHFGQVIGMLIEAGVESYHADYRARVTTYYLPNGETCRVPLLAPSIDIPQDFGAEALVRAIRGAQRGEVMYPQFMQLSMAAGCVGYVVWIAGRHVSYFGRRGEVHIEHFPS